MTTTTTAPAPAWATGTPQRTAARRAARRFLRSLLISGAWLWAIWAVFVAGVPLAVDRWGGEMDGLTYDAAGGPARWVAFAVGTIVTASLLNVHVAAGGTRRAFVLGAARAGAVAGVLYGVMTVVIALAERRLYAEIDRYWQGTAAPLDPATPVGAVVTAVGEGLVVVTYVLVGLSVIAGFRRFGPWRGTLTILPLLVPAALADLATGTGLAGIPTRGGYDDVVLGTLVAVGGALAAAALAGVVAQRMLRDAPVRP